MHAFEDMPEIHFYYQFKSIIYFSINSKFKMKRHMRINLINCFINGVYARIHIRGYRMIYHNIKLAKFNNYVYI